MSSVSDVSAVFVTTPPTAATRACKTCHHSVHVTCGTIFPYSVELECHHCAPPQGRHSVTLPPSMPKRLFQSVWCSGRPWLKYDGTKMWCAACLEYPQNGCPKCWTTDGVAGDGLKLYNIKRHGASQQHGIYVALWESGGHATSRLGALPLKIRNGVNSLFRTVYRLVLRTGTISHLPQDGELKDLNGATLVLTHLHRHSGREFFDSPCRRKCACLVDGGTSNS